MPKTHLQVLLAQLKLTDFEPGISFFILKNYYFLFPPNFLFHMHCTEPDRCVLLLLAYFCSGTVELFRVRTQQSDLN